MLRIAATMLLLAATGGLAVGCGSSNSASAIGVAVSASGPITETRALAYAHAVNLRTVDVPEMSVGSPEGKAPAPRRSGVAFARCYGGLSPARRILAIHSPEFSVGRAAQAQLEKSEVEVWPTSLLAARNFAANHTFLYRGCLVRFQEADNKNGNKRRVGQLQYGPVTISPLPSPFPGVNRSYGFRIEQIFLRGDQIRLRIYHDVFGFVFGPAETQMTATGFSQPVPSTTERRLLLLLYSRATTNKL